VGIYINNQLLEFNDNNMEMKTELKTLKDLYFSPDLKSDAHVKKKLKQEAIKWWIFKHGRGEDVCCTCEEIWREFFNITSEDLE